MVSKFHLIGTLVVVMATVASSLFGLLNPVVYAQETANWMAQGIAQDWVNLLIISPLLLISVVSAYKRSLPALLVWMGLLIAHLYTFFIYAFTIHFSFTFPLYILVLGGSFYLLVTVLSSIPIKTIANKTQGSGISKIIAYTLIITGSFFYLLWSQELFSALMAGEVPQAIRDAALFTNPVHVLDMAFFLPSFIIVGIGVIKKKAWAYAMAAPLHIAALVMSVNIMAIFITFYFKGLSTDLAMLPLFLSLSLAQLTISTLYLKQTTLRSV